MIKKIKDFQTALQLYETSIIKFEEIMEKGIYVDLDKYVDMGIEAENFLREHPKSPDSMRKFLNHPSLCLRAFAAKDLLYIEEKKALKILQKIAQGTTFASIHAEKEINRWEQNTPEDIQNNIPPIKNLKQALNLYEYAAIKEGRAMIGLDYDEIAKKYRIIQRKAIDLIKKEKSLNKLKPLLTHPFDHLRVRIACDLIDIYPKEALQVLKEAITSKEEDLHMRGEMIILAHQTLDEYTK